MDIKKSICEIDWGLNPQFKNRGFAFESVKCLVDYIFNYFKMNKIIIFVWNGNDASKKLANKLGFVLTGIEKNARVKNGKEIDLYTYELLKRENV